MGTQTGVGHNAFFYWPSGVTVDPAGAFAIVADNGNHLVRRLNLSSGLVTTVAGNTSGAVGSSNLGYADGQGTAVKFYRPSGVTMDAGATFVVISDYFNNVLRRLDLTSGVVTTIAGSTSYGYSDGQGTAAKFYRLSGVTMDVAATFVIIADSGNHVLRRLNLSSGLGNDRRWKYLWGRWF